MKEGVCYVVVGGVPPKVKAVSATTKNGLLCVVVLLALAVVDNLSKQYSNVSILL